MKIQIIALSFLLSLALHVNAQPTPSPTDAEIIHILMTANNGEIDAGKMAVIQAVNPGVRDFANRMVSDHTNANKQLTSISRKLNISPMDNDTSKTLSDTAKKNMDQLKNLKSGDFDKIYIDQAVDDHKEDIDSIDKVLIPNAKQQELKDFLAKMRPTVASHLEQALNLQKSLNK